VTRRIAGAGLAVLLVAALAGCASTPPEQDPVQIKLNDLDTRLTRIERVVANQSLLELSNELDAMRKDVASLRNDVDELTNDLAESRKQQRDLYTDLDHRLKRLETRGAAGAPPLPSTGAPGSAPADAGAAAPAAPLPVPGGSDRDNYQAAFAFLKDSQYDKAIAAFQQFLSSFPDSQLADNAQYWLGEAYYVNKSFPEALRSFQRLVDNYPQSRKYPDALLKIGYCRYEMKQWEEAKTVLSQVAAQYSDTPAGRLAQQRLEKIAAEKH
jgi:tol-pal system protein YbgF